MEGAAAAGVRRPARSTRRSASLQLICKNAACMTDKDADRVVPSCRNGAIKCAFVAHKVIKVENETKEFFIAPIVNEKQKFLPLKAYEKAFKLELKVEKVEKARLRAGFHRMREVCYA